MDLTPSYFKTIQLKSRHILEGHIASIDQSFV